MPIDDLPEVAYFLTCLPICLNADMHIKCQMRPIEVSKILKLSSVHHLFKLTIGGCKKTTNSHVLWQAHFSRKFGLQAQNQLLEAWLVAMFKVVPPINYHMHW